MRDQNMRSSVRWADGTYDAKRACDECGSEACSFPVHTDHYKEVISKASYWNWISDNNLKEDSNGIKRESI